MIRGERRIGVLGGTFDPIHLGHLRAAEEAREALGLDEVRFVPASSPPHKQGRRIADDDHRARMVELAVADHPDFRCSRAELRRDGLSYSVDTLRGFRDAASDDESFYFLMGEDAFAEIHTWHETERVFELASVVVLQRPPAALRASIDHLPVAAREAFAYKSSESLYVHRSGTTLRFTEAATLNISATDIRERRKLQQSIRYLVPDVIRRYISQQGLYLAESD